MGIKLSSIKNFLFYLTTHPALKARPGLPVVFLSDERYLPIRKTVTEGIRAILGTESFPIVEKSFEELSPESLTTLLDGASAYVMFYESFSAKSIGPSGAACVL